MMDSRRDVTMGEIRKAVISTFGDYYDYPPTAKSVGSVVRMVLGLKTLQKFVAAHAPIHNHINFQRHLNGREDFKQNRAG